ncbi:hypothetical protein Agub_g9456, partial [Astrephomene gubernaculifera]
MQGSNAPRARPSRAAACSSSVCRPAVSIPFPPISSCIGSTNHNAAGSAYPVSYVSANTPNTTTTSNTNATTYRCCGLPNRHQSHRAAPHRALPPSGDHPLDTDGSPPKVPRIAQPSTALLLAWLAAGGGSLLAAQCLVEALLRLHRE